MKAKRKWPLCTLATVALVVGLGYLVDFFPEEDKAMRREIREAVVTSFPREAAEAARSYGLADLGPVALDPASVAAQVVLVHGLDDPGKVWMNLAPALAVEGMHVWQMTYPNDQPIEDSARLLYEELLQLKQSGIDRVSIVAHSMGGLVSREMLTNPEFNYGEKARAGDLPSVTALIMVGTPNHGSELARFRFFGEIRNQWVNVVENGGHVLGGFMDGAGEAKIDLLPESLFLTSLNARPHPEGVKMLIIAGLLSPWDEQELGRLLEENLESDTAAEMETFFQSMSHGLGDGLVTVESTRLDGVEHRTVPGTHLSMIRNLSAGSQRVAPSIPIIIELLKQD